MRWRLFSRRLVPALIGVACTGKPDTPEDTACEDTSTTSESPPAIGGADFEATIEPDYPRDRVVVGDLDGDGSDELFVGDDSNAAGAKGGAVWILGGPFDGEVALATGAPDQAYVEEYPCAGLGREIVSLGDVDERGRPDFAASRGDTECHITSYHLFAGESYERRDPLAPYALLYAESGDGAQGDIRVYAAADLNGDGVADVSARSTFDTSNYWLPGPILGDTNILGGIPLVPDGVDESAVGGDVNGDGYADTLYGGALYLGSADPAVSLATPFAILEALNDARDSDVLTMQGDIDGDGRADLVVGANGQEAGVPGLVNDVMYNPDAPIEGTGEVDVFTNIRSGTFSLDDAHLRFTGDPSIIGFGRRALAQDLDGSGRDDLVVTFVGLPSGYYGGPYATLTGAAVFLDPVAPTCGSIPFARADGAVLSIEADGLIGDWVEVIHNDPGGLPSLLVGSDAWDHMYSIAAMLGME